MAERLVEIRGGDLGRAARALLVAGSGGFRAVLSAEEKAAAEQTARGMRSAIPQSLPRSGGLADLVASSTTFDVSTSNSAAGVTTTIKAESPYGIDRMNSSGTVTHPVYGDRSDWVTQSAGVTRGFLDTEVQQSHPEVAAQAAVTTTAKIIDRSV